MIATHTISAAGKSLGRVATQVAVLLMGKNDPAFRRHVAPRVTVRVQEVSRLAVHPRKLKGQTHVRYSGYPGGLKTETWAKTAERKGYSEILRRAVYGMLPKNKLRSKMIKNLIIS